MLDHTTNPCADQTGGERVEITDYRVLGEIVRQWVDDPGSRPKDVADLRRQLNGVASVPPCISEIEFCQGSQEKLVLRLPAKTMLEDSIDAANDPVLPDPDPLPQFYEDFFRPRHAPVTHPLDLLYSRIADYAISQCR